MGNADLFVCKKCRYEFYAATGIGMMFPIAYKHTVEEIKDGKYGEEWKRHLEDHPDAAVNCESDFFVCVDCGVPKTDLNLSLFLPVKKRKRASYVLPDDLKKRKQFQLLAEYTHRCEKCNGVCKQLGEDERPVLKCPECDGEMEIDISRMMLWD